MERLLLSSGILTLFRRRRRLQWPGVRNCQNQRCKALATGSSSHAPPPPLWVVNPSRSSRAIRPQKLLRNAFLRLFFFGLVWLLLLLRLLLPFQPRTSETLACPRYPGPSSHRSLPPVEAGLSGWLKSSISTFLTFICGARFRRQLTQGVRAAAVSSCFPHLPLPLPLLLLSVLVAVQNGGWWPAKEGMREASPKINSSKKRRKKAKKKPVLRTVERFRIAGSRRR